MKKIFVLALTLSFAAVAAAQGTNTINWKEKVVGQWAYESSEQFGVVTPADSTQATDAIAFSADGSFTRTLKGKQSTGTYTINESNRTVSLKEAGGKTHLLYLKKSDPGVLILETQTPDLIRTRHRFVEVKSE